MGKKNKSRNNQNGTNYMGKSKSQNTRHEDNSINNTDNCTDCGDNCKDCR